MYSNVSKTARELPRQRQPELRFSLFSHPRLCGGLQQAAVEVGPEEARVRVFLHQAVDDPLGVVEAEPRGRRQVPPDQLSGLVIDVDLREEALSVVAGYDRAEGGVLPLWQRPPGCSV